MKRATLGQGLWIGALTGCPLLALLYLANQAFAAPFVPYDFWNWQARVVPGNALSLAMSWPGTILATLFGGRESAWGKASEQIASLVFFLAVLAGIGLLSAGIKRHTDRARTKAGLGGATGILVLTAVMELSRGLSRPLLSLTWLAVAYLGWGLLLDSILEGRAFAAVSGSTDQARRQGLIQLAGGTLGTALAALGIAQVIGDRDTGRGADEPLAGLITVTPDPPTPTVQGATLAPTTLEPTPTTAPLQMPIGDDGRIVPVPGTREEITPRGEFYRVDINASPLKLDGNSWRLVIAGLFDRTPRLTRNELRAYPVHTQAITLSCISNPIGGTAISSAYWTGLRLSDLLEDLGLQSEAQALFIQSADGFYETVPMDDMMDPRTLLVYGMNGSTLPDKHGFPLRIYIPNRYGMKQPKWVERIEATATDKGGYWTDRGWSKEAIPNTTSVIDVVGIELEESAHIPIGGVAWAGARGIQKVEIQVDDSDWQEATLRTPSPGPLLWVQWRYHWPVASGPHTFTVRATDGHGDLQTAERRGTLPNGATGYHSVEVQV